MANTPDDKKFSPMDKALPNVQNLDLDKEDTAPSVDVNLEPPAPTSGPQITDLADGGAEVNFDPNQVTPQDPNDHFANLADLLPDSVLGTLGSDLYEKHMDYKASRKEWEDTYTKGLDLIRISISKLRTRTVSRS